MRFLILLMLLLVSTVEAHPTSNAPATIQVREFLITVWIGQPDWELECDYQINDEGWQHAKVTGKGEVVEIQLPGTSATIAVVGDFDLKASYEEDVKSVVFQEKDLTHAYKIR